jgi:DNA-binding CsgD family transcriptional regulator
MVPPVPTVPPVSTVAATGSFAQSPEACYPVLMALRTVIFNVFSLSTAVGALVGLAILFLLFRGRGFLLLFLFILFLSLDYCFGIILFATSEAAPSTGFPDLVLFSVRERTLMAVKFLLLLGGFVTGPLAVHALLRTTIRPAVLSALAAGGAAVYGLSIWQLLLTGTSLALHPSFLILPVFSVYALYLYCFFVLLKHRSIPLGRIAGQARKTAIIGLACIIPVMALEDLYLVFSAGPPRVIADPLAFLFLTGATVLFVMLFLVQRGRHSGQPEDLEAFAERYDLSEREREVAALLVAGLRYKEIADRLCISLDTVKTHASHIYRKTSSSGRVELRFRLGARPS